MQITMIASDNGSLMGSSARIQNGQETMKDEPENTF